MALQFLPMLLFGLHAGALADRIPKRRIAATRTRTRTIVGAAAVFGILQAAAALAPGIAVFLVLLAAMGFVNLVCQSMANSSVQLAVDPGLRGRVMGLYMLVFIGGTPVGAPSSAR